MTSERVYRSARSSGEARVELERGAGSQFDPRVVGAFMRVLDRLGVPRNPVGKVQRARERGRPPTPPDNLSDPSKRPRS